jgi:hypothetical protein
MMKLACIQQGSFHAELDREYVTGLEQNINDLMVIQVECLSEQPSYTSS